MAVVGAGLMGQWHAHYARRLGAQLVAVVDKSREAAQRLAGAAGRTGVFGEVGEMLDAARPSVVHICTPTATHLPIALEAIAAGAHALVEKPLTATAGETRELIEAARERGVHVCPVHQFGFQKGVERAREVLPLLGEPLYAAFTICSAGGDTNCTASLNEIARDILPHPLSVLQRLWPKTPLHSGEWSMRSPGPGELHAFRRLGAMEASVLISMGARPTRCEMGILCRGGSIHLDFFHGFAVVRRGVPSRRDKIIQPFQFAATTIANAAGNLAGRLLRREMAYPGLFALVERFYAASAGRAEVPISGQDALAVALVRDSLLQQGACPPGNGADPAGHAGTSPGYAPGFAS